MVFVDASCSMFYGEIQIVRVVSFCKIDRDQFVGESEWKLKANRPYVALVWHYCDNNEIAK